MLVKGNEIECLRKLKIVMSHKDLYYKDLYLIYCFIILFVHINPIYLLLI